jgi:hypothetical protein
MMAANLAKHATHHLPGAFPASPVEPDPQLARLLGGAKAHRRDIGINLRQLARFANHLTDVPKRGSRASLKLAAMLSL